MNHKQHKILATTLVGVLHAVPFIKWPVSYAWAKMIFEFDLSMFEFYHYRGLNPGLVSAIGLVVVLDIIFISFLFSKKPKPILGMSIALTIIFVGMLGLWLHYLPNVLNIFTVEDLLL